MGRDRVRRDAAATAAAAPWPCREDISAAAGAGAAALPPRPPPLHPPLPLLPLRLASPAAGSGRRCLGAASCPRAAPAAALAGRPQWAPAPQSQPTPPAPPAPLGQPPRPLHLAPHRCLSARLLLQRSPAAAACSAPRHACRARGHPGCRCRPPRSCPGAPLAGRRPCKVSRRAGTWGSWRLLARVAAAAAACAGRAPLPAGTAGRRAPGLQPAPAHRALLVGAAAAQRGCQLGPAHLAVGLRRVGQAGGCPGCMGVRTGCGAPCGCSAELQSAHAWQPRLPGKGCRQPGAAPPPPFPHPLELWPRHQLPQALVLLGRPGPVLPHVGGEHIHVPLAALHVCRGGGGVG